MLSFIFNFIIRCVERALYPAPHDATFYSEHVKVADIGRGRRVAYSLFYRGEPAAHMRAERPVLLFYHGNGMSLSSCESFVSRLSEHVDATIVVPEYANYVVGCGGRRCMREQCKCLGRPIEASDAVFETATARLLDEADGFMDFVQRETNPAGQRGVPSRIFLMGHSLGSGVATDLAARWDVAGLVLVSPYLSILSVVNATLARWLPFVDVLKSYEGMAHVSCSLLVFVGSADRLIPPWHADRLGGIYNAANTLRGGGVRGSQKYVTLDGEGHNSMLTPSNIHTFGSELISFINRSI